MGRDKGETGVRTLNLQQQPRVYSCKGDEVSAWEVDMKVRDVVRISSGAFAIVGMLAISEGCAATTRGGVYVRTGPPSPIVESRVAAPGPGYVWVPGFHRWDGAAYAWVGGRWERPPRARAAWVPGRWIHHRSGWHFVDGHWR